MEKKRNPNLDLLKLLACMAVVGLHIFTFTYEEPLISYLHYASGYAVPVFFMVNGFLILNKKEVSYSYVSKKIIHIVFITGLWNLTIFVAYLLLKREILNPVLMLLQSWIQKGYLWQFWFLGAMILTYLCAPVVHRIVQTFRYGYFILTFGLLVVCLVVQVWSSLTGESKTDKIIQTFQLWAWLFYFVLGGWLHKLMPRIDKSISKKLHFGVAVTLIIGFPLYQLLIGKTINFGSYYTDPVAICCNTLLFTSIMRVKFSDSTATRIVYLSSLGMGCYILHPIFLNVINQKINYELILTPFVLYPIILVVSMFITAIMKKWKPTRIFVDL